MIYDKANIVRLAALPMLKAEAKAKERKAKEFSINIRASM